VSKEEHGSLQQRMVKRRILVEEKEEIRDKMEVGKFLFFIAGFLLGICVIFSAGDLNRKKQCLGIRALACQKRKIEIIPTNDLSNSDAYKSEEISDTENSRKKELANIDSEGCGIHVIHDFLSTDADIAAVKSIADATVGRARPNGSISIYDFSAKALTYEDIYVKFDPLSWSEKLSMAHLLDRISEEISKIFLPSTELHPTSPMFLSSIRGSKQDLKDGGIQYWHPHVDQETYDNINLHYSAILYLDTQGIDFEGGSLYFFESEEENELKDESSPLTVDEIVIPSAGTLVIFSSGPENPHSLQMVEETVGNSEGNTNGKRRALTAFFTCDPAFKFDIMSTP